MSGRPLTHQVARITAARSRSASRSTSASSSSRRSTASAPTRWRCSPTPGTICPTCSAWSSPGRARRWRKRSPSRALHLRAQESLDPRRADQRLVPAGRGRRDRRRSDPPAVRARADRGADDDGRRRDRRSSINGVTALLFARGQSDDINIRGAFLHMAADAAVSAAVVVRRARHPVDRPAMDRPGDEPGASPRSSCGAASACSRNWCGCRWPGVPSGIVARRGRARARASSTGSTTVHDLHVWPLSTTETALTAHLVAPGGRVDRRLAASSRGRMLHDRFGIEHSTHPGRARAPSATHDC